MNRKVTALASSVSVIAGLLIGAWGWHQVSATVTQAESLLNRVRGIVPGKSTFAEVDGLRTDYSNVMRTAPGCRPEECSFSFSIYNSLLRKTLLAPPAVFSGSIEVKNGKVDVVLLAYLQDNHRRITSVTIGINESCKKVGPFVRLDRDEKGRPRKAIIGIDSCTPTEDREKFLRINVRCLERIGGCKDAEQLLPALLNTPPD
jgi:hypothetical protein